MSLQKGSNGNNMLCKMPFLNRDCVEYNADYFGEYTDIRKEEMRILAVQEKIHNKRLKKNNSVILCKLKENCLKSCGT